MKLFYFREWNESSDIILYHQKYHYFLQVFREGVFSKFIDLVRIHMASEVLNGMTKVDSEISASSHFVDSPTGKDYFS